MDKTLNGYVKFSFLLEYIKSIPTIEATPLKRCKITFEKGGEAFCHNCRQNFKVYDGMGWARARYCPYCGGLSEDEYNKYYNNTEEKIGELMGFLKENFKETEEEAWNENRK